MSKKRIPIKERIRQLAAVMKFETKYRAHRHHWPLRSAADGVVSIARCECGEPYPKEKP